MCGARLRGLAARSGEHILARLLLLARAAGLGELAARLHQPHVLPEVQGLGLLHLALALHPPLCFQVDDARVPAPEQLRRRRVRVSTVSAKGCRVSIHK